MDQQKSSLQHFIRQIIPLADTDVAEIIEKFEPVSYKKGSHLLKQGQLSDDYLFLETGLMRGYLYDLEGNQITTDFYTSTGVAFEVTSFFKRVISEVNIQAITECEGYRINYADLNYLFHALPAFRDFGRAILVREFIASKQRNNAMINQSAETRYQNLLASRPEILLNAPLKYIASYLGITDSTLSRIRRKFGQT